MEISVGNSSIDNFLLQVKIIVMKIAPAVLNARKNRGVKIMKRLCVFVLVLCAACSFVFAQTSLILLDEAIRQGARDIEGRLDDGVKVVVLNFNSPSERLSNYVLDELLFNLVNGGKLVVVDRQNLALIQQEMDFQMSGEVSDVSAQAIGMKLGAQSIISGVLEDMGNSFRIRLRVIEVVSAAIQGIAAYNVKKDNQTAMLLSGLPGTSTTSSSASGSPGFQTPAVLPNGLNFTTGRKVTAGFLNIPFGMGSFTMGDWAGGLITAGFDAAAITFLVLSLQEETYYSYDGDDDDDYDRNEERRRLYPWAGYAAIGCLSAAVVYGFVQPFIYDVALAKKNGSYLMSSNPMDHINIALIPDKEGIQAVQMSFSMRF